MTSNTTEQRPKSGALPEQSMPYPGHQSQMERQPDTDLSNYHPADDAVTRLKPREASFRGSVNT